MEKKRLFRIAALAVAVIMAVAMSGCGGSKTGGGNGGGGGGGQVNDAGDTTSDSLQIGLLIHGYGEEFLRQLCAAFEKKTGIKTELTQASAAAEWIAPKVQGGPTINELDIIFDINPRLFANVAKSNYVKGYERCYADLSEVYERDAEGYGEGLKIKDIVEPSILASATWGGEDAGYGDGKRYLVPYATGIEGLVYNADLFEQYKLAIPKTTNQLLAVMDKIKGLGAKNKDGRTIYAWEYSGQVGYSNFVAQAWWAQFDGLDTFNKILQGKDASGNYSADSLKTQGRLSAMMIVEKILNPDNGYTDSSTNYTQTFTDAQVRFLDKQAFMMSNGDWLEREMEGNFSGSDLNVKFMRTPVNSDIVMKCDSVKNDDQLAEAVTYIDGEGSRPAWLSDADEKILTEARSIYGSEGYQHMAYVPAYSDNVAGAKDFLAFMLSKEGQEIVMKYCAGNTAPITVDLTAFDAYKGVSSLQKSKIDMMSSKIGMSLVGGNYSHPMGYAGNIKLFYNNPGTMEGSFGGSRQSATYATAQQMWQSDIDNQAAVWSDIMTRAGVSE